MAKKTKQVSEATPAPQKATSGKTEAKPVTFVVVRDGFRVSEKEYTTQDDPKALAEVEFWKTVAKKHSYGEPVEIVQYDSKKHRVW